ncbi:hypothetical protein [Anabaena azotica]|uniref:Uncharacterized protein n=1 Tax=Anabaena azotica FACHB-119 TaxID=947527 RepID=A0ABR8D669_9NOST|nr:hypothetical protein [Anabaena azotica]MBD2501727.1 hypothetical protein [Anabaena azotica FACHB-119]
MLRIFRRSLYLFPSFCKLNILLYKLLPYRHNKRSPTVVMRSHLADYK